MGGIDVEARTRRIFGGGNQPTPSNPIDSTSIRTPARRIAPEPVLLTGIFVERMAAGERT
jgi:hypothetical protein